VVLAALVTLFALGFAGPFLNVTGHIALVVIGLPYLSGRRLSPAESRDLSTPGVNLVWFV
jgi:hypothetical protein